MSRIISPIKIFGGKAYLAKDICPLLKNALSSVKDPIYVEGFLGGANILLNLNYPCKKYFAFDIDPLLINCWKVIQEYPYDLQNALKEYDYNEETFLEAKEFVQRWELSWKMANHLCDKHLLAIQYLIRNRMSRAGLNKDYGWSNRLRRGKYEYISAWETTVDSLPAIANKIKNVHFAWGDCIDLMKLFKLNENPNVIVYADPPYMKSTRVSKNAYSYEMNIADHKELWLFMKLSKCIFFLSGYNCPEYEKWTQFGNVKIIMKKEIKCHSSQKKIKPIREEILWKIN